ncbi:Putative glycosyltransferase EpsE [Achromobacter agilis]|uniref:Glycosyltransferase EpsE n=2 Tax=Achromobacter agilis TaxID=1353888 RepID=A0A446CYF9_9BURK|nr:Putative glycosyltransferase EpsE [Achromobacter agilis]
MNNRMEIGSADATYQAFDLLLSRLSFSNQLTVEAASQLRLQYNQASEEAARMHAVEISAIQLENESNFARCKAEFSQRIESLQAELMDLRGGVDQDSVVFRRTNELQDIFDTIGTLKEQLSGELSRLGAMQQPKHENSSDEKHVFSALSYVARTAQAHVSEPVDGQKAGSATSAGTASPSQNIEQLASAADTYRRKARNLAKRLEVVCNEKQKEIDALNAAIEVAEDRIKLLARALISQYRDLLVASGDAGEYKTKYERIKEHLSYRIGTAVVQSSKTLQGWFKMPAAMLKARREYYEAKELPKKIVLHAPPLTIKNDQKSGVFASSTDWTRIVIEAAGTDRLLTLGAIPLGEDGDLRISYRISGISGEVISQGDAEISAKKVGLGELPRGLTYEFSFRKTNRSTGMLVVTLRTVKTVGNKKGSASEPVVRPNEGSIRDATQIVSSKRKKPVADVLRKVKAMLDIGQVDEGFAFGERYVNDLERPALELLRANYLLENEAAWLKVLNNYVARFGIAHIKLVPGNAPKYLRLKTGTVPPIKTGPLISVIMPAFNCEKTLFFAANSILTQQWRRLELIIIDDCSSDGTWQVMKNLALQDSRVKIFRNKRNCGPYVCKNIGLYMAEGEYITGHDSDDWAHPERLSKHIQAVLDLGDTAPRASAIKMLRMRLDGEFDRVSNVTQNTYDGLLQTAFIGVLFEAQFLKQKLGHWDSIRFGADSEMINRCRHILGDEFVVFDQLAMICLDSDDGLTAHPVFGVRGRTSDLRKAYKQQFLQHHESLLANNKSLYMPFPHFPRVFPVGEGAALTGSDLNAAYEVITARRDLRNLDVCIITDLRFPGGNASSTLDEVDSCVKAGLRVRIIHSPSSVSEGKPISDRYHRIADLLELQQCDIGQIETKLLIVRHPRVICSERFRLLAERVTAQHAVYLINNSIFNGSEEAIYDVESLNRNTVIVSAESSAIYPLGPRIRRELADFEFSVALADNDWHPLFDASYYADVSKESVAVIPTIGRHGRDHKDKWPTTRDRLLKIYPDNSEVRVAILGGADFATELIGYRPKNWNVHPFGSMSPPDFLSSLDFFVYFPAENLNEAFGRTVMEAIFSGIPCILPESFKDSFGDFAFYVGPEDVLAAIARIRQRNNLRYEFVRWAREAALATFDSSAFFRRMRRLNLDIDTATVSGSQNDSVSELPDHLRDFKQWVEGNQGYSTLCDQQSVNR